MEMTYGAWQGAEKNNEEENEREPSLKFLMVQARDIIDRLEDDLDMNYEDYKNQPAEVGGKAFLSERETEIDEIKFLYKLMKTELLSLKEKRLKEVNKKILSVFESEKSSKEEKEKSIEDYLSESDPLISDKDHSSVQKMVSNDSFLKGNLLGLNSLVRQLKPSVEVGKERLKRIISEDSNETQKTRETIENIKIIHEGLSNTAEQDREITDKGFKSLTDACVAIEVLIGMIDAKVAVYKHKLEEKREPEKKQSI